MPNPSFESYTTCPNSPNELDKALGWNSFRASPDYYNICSSNTGMVSIPNNWAGYQQPASGNAYSGFSPYSSSGYREFLGSMMSTTLTIGVKYFVSFKISLSISSTLQTNCASSKMGVKFSTNAFDIFNQAPINNNSKVYANAVVTDSLNWTKIFGSFVSDSAYKYLMLGNFFNNSNTDTLIMNGDPNCESYYYLDDVCVSTDSLYALQYIFTGMKNSDLTFKFNMFPNPIRDVLYIENVSEIYDVSVYNSFGQLIFSKYDISENILIDATHFVSGLIFIEIKSKNYQQIKKYIKQ